MNNITINTDASYHPIHRVGGFAFYIVCDLFKIQKGGKFKHNPQNPMDAEIKCIGNALATVLIQKLPTNVNYIIVNTDCQFGINKIKTHPSKTAKKIRKLIEELKAKTNCKNFEFRYVKAHNGTPDARSFANNWCDLEAKRWMRKQLKK